MTGDEFQDWFAYHQACFTGVAGWLEKATRGTEAPSRKQVLSSWARALRDVDIADAKAATDAIHSGREDEPVGFDRHPGAIAGIARKLARGRGESVVTYHDGQRTVACRDCFDDGFVLCWHPNALAALVSGDATPTKLNACAVTCHCRAGDRRVEPRNRNEKPRFDPLRWCRLNHIQVGSHCVLPRTSEPEQQRLALEWIEEWRSRRVTSQPNYEPAFAEFGGEQTKMEFQT